MLDEAGAKRFGDDLGTRPDVEGRRDLLEAVLDRVRAQMDERGDLLVGETARDVSDDGDVALGERRPRLAVVAGGGVGDHARGDLAVAHRVSALHPTYWQTT